MNTKSLKNLCWVLISVFTLTACNGKDEETQEPSIDGIWRGTVKWKTQPEFDVFAIAAEGYADVIYETGRDAWTIRYSLNETAPPIRRGGESTIQLEGTGFLYSVNDWENAVVVYSGTVNTKDHIHINIHENYFDLSQIDGTIDLYYADENYNNIPPDAIAGNWNLLLSSLDSSSFFIKELTEFTLSINSDGTTTAVETFELGDPCHMSGTIEPLPSANRVLSIDLNEFPALQDACIDAMSPIRAEGTILDAGTQNETLVMVFGESGTSIYRLLKFSRE